MSFPKNVAVRVAAIAAAGLGIAGLVSIPAVGAAGASPSGMTITSTGLQPGQVKHVWTIMLENKSYDATFTGLNQNSYLWKTLPSQGVLLQDYYGTGHFSQDNYESAVSGQSPSADLQSDCDKTNSDLGSNATIITTHTGTPFGQTDNYGQVVSNPTPNSPDGQNGCTFPSDVPTLFNQFDAANVTWKGYAQDLHNTPGREDGTAGSPGTTAFNPTSNPFPMSPTYTGATPADQYVAKHFPFPWFHSIIDGSLTTPVGGGTDSDAAHIANLDDPSRGLLADLAKPADQVPAFNWITPNNCSDAHDATCAGNNLSGVFDASGNPDYSKPLTTPAVNSTGGLYAADLFLKYYIPLIERSAAFKDGGVIDITFDEANPPFTNMSFNNATDQTPVAQAARGNMLYSYAAPTVTDTQAAGTTLAANLFPAPGPLAKDYLKADLAGQNIDGKNVDWEPTGPNATLQADSAGNQLFPGPGDNGYIVRPPSCEQDAKADAAKDNCVAGAKNTGSAFGYAAAVVGRTASAPAGSATVNASILPTDIGRAVTGTPAGSIPAGTYVGAVVDSGPNPTGSVTTGSFTLVDATGAPVQTTAAVTAIGLSALGVPGHLNAGETAAAAFDATDPTPGGGITGSVLISPLIKPGTVSTTSYNHYSWLRTMEDVFQVSNGSAKSALAAGSVSGGLDGQGHLGFAAQAGLAPFGTDVFNNAAVTAAAAPTLPPTGVETAAVVGMAGSAVLLVAGGVTLVLLRRRRTARR
ncbi:hypothetical protein [Pseudolysinimonas sp.]|uniref:hypothetical protein n=1 Tax=Pseudolysinimonas sp. TaxID=2680009 RepID=UPI003F7CFB2C